MSTHDFSQRDLRREITTLHWEYTTPLSQTQTSTQEVDTKPKQRKGLQLGDLMITNSLLVISKDHK